MEPNQATASNHTATSPSGSSPSTGGTSGARGPLQLKEQLRGQEFATQERQLTPREGKDAGPVQRKSTGGSAGGAVQLKPAVQREGTPGVYEDQANVGQAGVSVQGPQTGRASTTVGYSTQGGGTVSAAREWQIWPAPGAPPIPPVPIAAVPGMFVTWTPSVKASVGASFAGVQQGEPERQYSASISGSILGGIEYGVPPAASIYLRFGPTVQAQMQGTFDSQGLKQAEGSITLDAAITAGAQAGGGQFDYSVTLARANIGRFVGFRYTRGVGTVYGTFEPGRPLLDAIEWGRSAARRANELYEAAAAPVRRVGSALSSAWAWVTS